MVLGLKPMGKVVTPRGLSARSCMVLRVKSMRKLVTPEAQALDRTKVLHGPRTQTYGETSYFEKISKC